MAAKIPAVSKEYLHGPVSSNVALDTQTVSVAFLPKTQAAPDNATVWNPAEWEGPVGQQRTWKLLIGPGTSVPLTPAEWMVWVKVADTIEQPVRQHDILTIT